MGAITHQVIDQRPALVHDAAINLHRFLIIDSVLLDIAGVAALLQGATELGLVLVTAAAVVFLAGLGRRRQLQASPTTAALCASKGSVS